MFRLQVSPSASERLSSLNRPRASDFCEDVSFFRFSFLAFPPLLKSAAGPLVGRQQRTHETGFKSSFYAALMPSLARLRRWGGEGEKRRGWMRVATSHLAPSESPAPSAASSHIREGQICILAGPRPFA